MSTAKTFPIGLPAVNLLSPSVFEAMAVRRLRRRFVAAGLVLVLLVAGGWEIQHLRSEQAAKLLVVERGETTRLTTRTQELAPVNEYVAEVGRQKIVVKNTMASEALLSKVLDQLAAVVPAGVRIESLEAVMDAATPPARQSAGQPANDTAACPAPNPFVASSSVGCVTLTGTASSRAAVGQLVGRLISGGVFVAPYITTTATSDSKLTFTGSVAVTKRVYSNRYADLDALLSRRATS